MTESSVNPFAALLGDSINTSSAGKVAKLTEEDGSGKIACSNFLERVFLFTLNENSSRDESRPSKCVFLKELQSSLDGQTLLDEDILAQALFERTLMQDAFKLLVQASASNATQSASACEERVVFYLYECYKRLKQEDTAFEETSKRCESVLIECTGTCLQQPILYEGQDPLDQMQSIFFDDFFCMDSQSMQTFFENVYRHIYETSGIATLSTVIEPIFKRMHRACRVGLLGKLCSDPDSSKCLNQLSFFTRNTQLAELLIQYSTPRNPSATAYEKSLLGCIASSSCAPNSYSGGSDLFSSPSTLTQNDISRDEQMIYVKTELITNGLHTVFLKIAKLSPSTKHALLSWISGLLHANYGRVKLASTMSLYEGPPRDECSDGLMLNLCSVMLKLCQPFSQPHNPKLLKIAPAYCRKEFKVPEEQKARHHHAFGLPQQTFLIPLEENVVQQLPDPADYGFVCDLYFLTQLSLYLGFHAAFERFINLNRELNRLQGVYQQMQEGGGATTNPNFEALKFMFESSMKKFLQMKAALTTPELLQASLQFNISSATYLTHLATRADSSSTFEPLKFPLPPVDTIAIGCVPEFVLNNITDVMVVVRRFKSSFFQNIVDQAGHIMDLILVLMGSKNRVKNPHLRAKLAEVLSELMPIQDDRSSHMQTSEFIKAKLFLEHPNIDRLAEVLFTVFVSIETTGESVQFEQKLNYRQPMYKVLDYIWKSDLHRKAIQNLAAHSLQHIEDTDPPLFLKFTNLLVNDANFLLDEALSYMRQLREKEEENERRPTPLPVRELQQYEANISHMRMLARFHNTAAVDTTHTLALLTAGCANLFCHSVMVERIAAMLNYFLVQLTGPNMNEMKVKNFDKYEFRPSVIVSDICQIYINLGTSDTFCTAVSADGRSYSPELFPRAERVLQKIYQPVDMIQAFNDLATKIKTHAQRQSEDDEFLVSAPEEFIDPIMGTLMKDPVKLPSSKITVDKSTIARHILSDQSDPFNRSPLSLDQVIPDTQLKEKIEAWLIQKRASLS